MRLHVTRPRSTVATTVSLAIALGGLSLAAAAPSQAAAPAGDPAFNQGPDLFAPGIPTAIKNQKLAWSECYPGDGLPELQCAAVRAPRDWDDPGGPKITVAVSRIRATDPSRRRGVMFSNPGGPGGDGLTMPLFFEDSEPDVQAVYDTIGIDPRGVGNSTVLTCADPAIAKQLYDLDGRDTSAANQKLLLKLDTAYGNTCSKDPFTAEVTTYQTIRDFDLVRALLGEKKISYVGFSAGTWLGANYASTFPQRTDRFVLDGNIEFTGTLYDSFARQPRGFQNSFEKYFQPWAADHQELFGLGPTARRVKATYEKRRAILASHPLTLSDGSVLTAAGYDGGIGGGLYWTGYYEELATAMAALEHYATATDDEKVAVLDFFGPYELGDVFWSVVCQDQRGPSYAQVLSDTARFQRNGDLLTGASWNAYPCPFFTTRAVKSPPVDGRSLPPLLMVNNDDDPATPLASALAARSSTPRATLITVRDEPDHTIYGSGDECADAYINAWLLRGVLPKRDAGCAGVPLPEPATGAAGRAAAGAASRSMPAPVWARQFVVKHGVPTVG